MPALAPVLVCFAMEDEARRFRSQISHRPDCEILLTGIGPRNAAQALERALKSSAPGLVLSSGFAGGLNPEHQAGTVGFELPSDSSLASALLGLRAKPMRFHTTNRIASTAEAKLDLWHSTGADAVEMESGRIREICAQRKISSATIRIISDAAQEDLPLDFNQLMTADQRLDYVKLAWALAKSPGTVARLWSFRGRMNAFAAKLAGVLSGVLGAVARNHRDTDSTNGHA